MWFWVKYCYIRREMHAKTGLWVEKESCGWNNNFKVNPYEIISSIYMYMYY